MKNKKEILKDSGDESDNRVFCCLVDKNGETYAEVFVFIFHESKFNTSKPNLFFKKKLTVKIIAR